MIFLVILLKKSFNLLEPKLGFLLITYLSFRSSFTNVLYQVGIFVSLGFRWFSYVIRDE